MRKILLLICCLWSLQGIAQNGYKPVTNTDAFQKEFMQATQATHSIVCDFVQEKSLSMLADKITSTGKFWYEKENKVRMEYEKPTYYLLVINGDMIKTKDAEKENKVSAKSNKMFGEINKMVINCVKGNVFDNKQFTTKVSENGKYYLVALSPTDKNLQSIFKTIDLTVDKKDFSTVQIEMQEQSGDKTVIHFLHKKINTTIPDAIFSVK